jgi:hypothetical protein
VTVFCSSQPHRPIIALALTSTVAAVFVKTEDVGTKGQPMISRFSAAAALLALLAVSTPASSASADRDEQLQERYRLCINKADSDFLEEFRSGCDVLCIHRKHGSDHDCLARHMKWDTANCTVPTSQADRQEQHLEKAKDRCLREFKAGITTPP